MSKFVEMGSYYQADKEGLVRTVCKAYDPKGDGSAQIVYVKVKKDGCVSDAYLMPEYEFRNTFLYHIK